MIHLIGLCRLERLKHINLPIFFFTIIIIIIIVGVVMFYSLVVMPLFSRSLIPSFPCSRIINVGTSTHFHKGLSLQQADRDLAMKAKEEEWQTVRQKLGTELETLQEQLKGETESQLVYKKGGIWCQICI